VDDIKEGLTLPIWVPVVTVWRRISHMFALLPSLAFHVSRKPGRESIFSITAFVEMVGSRWNTEFLSMSTTTTGMLYRLCHLGRRPLFCRCTTIEQIAIIILSYFKAYTWHLRVTDTANAVMLIHHFLIAIANKWCKYSNTKCTGSDACDA
jgi:hypothetical protein